LTGEVASVTLLDGVVSAGFLVGVVVSTGFLWKRFVSGLIGDVALRDAILLFFYKINNIFSNMLKLELNENIYFRILLDLLQVT
jgi:hypothetical protein